jgi:AraC-like DNA-binding protein
MISAMTLPELALRVDRAITSTEKAYHCWVSIHDVGGGLAGCVPAERLQHRHPFCQQVKYRGHRARCAADDGEALLPLFRANPEPRLRRCHAGATEIIGGLMIRDRLDAILFAGIAVADTMTVRHLPRSSFPPLPTWTAEDLVHLQEGVQQLLTRLASLLQPALPDQWMHELRDREHIIRHFIRYHHCEPIGLADLATAMDLSIDRTRHVVRECCGKSWQSLLTTARLETACLLLVNSDLDILQIALRCGFHSAEVLHRHFQHQFQSTPHAWRKQQRLQS